MRCPVCHQFLPDDGVCQSCAAERNGGRKVALIVVAALVAILAVTAVVNLWAVDWDVKCWISDKCRKVMP